VLVFLPSRSRLGCRANRLISAQFLAVSRLLTIATRHCFKLLTVGRSHVFVATFDNHVLHLLRSIFGYLLHNVLIYYPM
jgi:hypothetical protein